MYIDPYNYMGQSYTLLQVIAGTNFYNFTTFFTLISLKVIQFKVKMNKILSMEVKLLQEDEKMDKMRNSPFLILCTSYITTQPIFVYWLFFTHS